MNSWIIKNYFRLLTFKTQSSSMDLEFFLTHMSLAFGVDWPDNHQSLPILLTLNYWHCAHSISVNSNTPLRQKVFQCVVLVNVCHLHHQIPPLCRLLGGCRLYRNSNALKINSNCLE